MGRPRKIRISEDQNFADAAGSETVENTVFDVEVDGAQDSEIVSIVKESLIVAPTISDEEYQRRIKLDVSNPDYINPSYDR